MPGVEQHPIPQQITSYEFKLVGDMTIKQFGKAAGGIILAVMVNATPLVFFIKWPLMAILALGGLATAFIPFQDRPLEKWVIAFVRSLYAPTIFTWKKKVDPNWLEVDFSKKLNLEAEEEESRPKKEISKVDEFIKSIPSSKAGKIYFDDDDTEEITASTKTEAPKPTVAESINIVEEKKPQPEAIVVVEELKQVEKNSTDLNLKTSKIQATGLANFGDIPMPSKPTEPNILVGMVIDIGGKIISEAIVEIQNDLGGSERVLQTNSLGQFKTTTPLANGRHMIITEKDGMKFDTVAVNMTGAILEPIRIQALK